jgi:hypothetical protein
MSRVQRAAQVFGWAFVLVALLGFVVSRGSMDADPATAPRVLGIFPVNLPHNLVHLAFGVWGVVAARTWDAARTYCRVAGVLYLGLAVLGFIIPTTFGLMPIGGPDVGLHLLLGAGLAYFGFTAASQGRTAGSASAN